MSDLKLTKTDIKEGAPFAALSYIFCLWILVFIFKKDNKFSYFHARQAIVIFFCQVICFIFQLIPVIGIVFALANFFLMLISLYGIYISLKGQVKEIPVIGKLANKFVV